MKTKIVLIALFALLTNGTFAQDRTTVTATNADISDNLDLKAVASIFGDSKNLEDFERRLNDPKMQISNLDLNGDNQVDYLRVIESVEGNTHLIIVQAVLERDIFQDVATLEVEKDSRNNVQVQVVGDVYMYGNNYIYEPVYVSRPIIYDYFWVGGYHPYHSNYYWGYYPSYYTVWNPYPIYRYRRNVNVYINVHNHYNYVNTRRSSRAVALYNTRRSNGYEVSHPNRSFAIRNSGINNRHDLVQTRRSENSGTRNGSSLQNTRSNSTANVRNTNSINNQTVRTSTPSTTRGNATVRTSSATTPIQSNNIRTPNTAATVRSNNPTRTTSTGTTRNNASVTNNAQTVRTPASSSANTTRVQTQAPIRQSPMPSQTTRTNIQRTVAQPAMQTQRSTGNQNASRQSAQRSSAPQRTESTQSGRR